MSAASAATTFTAAKHKPGQDGCQCQELQPGEEDRQSFRSREAASCCQGAPSSAAVRRRGLGSRRCVGFVGRASVTPRRGVPDPSRGSRHSPSGTQVRTHAAVYDQPRGHLFLHDETGRVECVAARRDHGGHSGFFQWLHRGNSTWPQREGRGTAIVDWLTFNATFRPTAWPAPMRTRTTGRRPRDPRRCRASCGSACRSWVPCGHRCCCRTGRRRLPRLLGGPRACTSPGLPRGSRGCRWCSRPGSSPVADAGWA